MAFIVFKAYKHIKGQIRPKSHSDFNIQQAVHSDTIPPTQHLPVGTQHWNLTLILETHLAPDYLDNMFEHEGLFSKAFKFLYIPLNTNSSTW